MSKPKTESGTAQLAMIGLGVMGENLALNVANLPANLTQARRDVFGAPPAERVDKPGQGAVHTDWKSLAK